MFNNVPLGWISIYTLIMMAALAGGIIDKPDISPLRLSAALTVIFTLIGCRYRKV